MFLLLNLATLGSENFDFTLDISFKGLKGRENVKRETHTIFGIEKFQSVEIKDQAVND